MWSVASSTERSGSQAFEDYPGWNAKAIVPILISESSVRNFNAFLSLSLSSSRALRPRDFIRWIRDSSRETHCTPDTLCSSRVYIRARIYILFLDRGTADLNSRCREIRRKWNINKARPPSSPQLMRTRDRRFAQLKVSISSAFFFFLTNKKEGSRYFGNRCRPGNAPFKERISAIRYTAVRSRWSVRTHGLVNVSTSLHTRSARQRLVFETSAATAKKNHHPGTMRFAAIDLAAGAEIGNLIGRSR